MQAELESTNKQHKKQISQLKNGRRVTLCANDHITKLYRTQGSPQSYGYKAAASRNAGEILKQVEALGNTQLWTDSVKLASRKNKDIAQRLQEVRNFS